MEAILEKLRADFPDVRFIKGSRFRWSPSDQTISYALNQSQESSQWALFHELAHALLKHETYTMDIELLLMEVAAWHKAKGLALTYGYTISEDHIQDCLDTYRDWLDQRSTCPVCGNNSLQSNVKRYCCFNCRTVWQVSNSRFCRPYRQRNRNIKKTPPASSKQTTFQ